MSKWVLQLLVLSLVAATTFASEGLDDLLASSAKLEDWLIATRRELHQYPELSYEEFNTSVIIRRILTELNIPFRYPVAFTGVVATIGSGSPIVALRADIDALPILEDSGVAFTSRNPGKMHACGHDGHMTMLLGAAKLLKAREAQLKGTVRLLFQPGEEGKAGGAQMVKEGAMEGVAAAFGVHLWPTLPSGVVGTRAGTIMAGSLVYKVTITGLGGHAAIPHSTRDPVVAAAATVTALQTLVSRNTSPLEPAVVSVTKLWTDAEAYNVIPAAAYFGGTIRAMSDGGMAALRRRLEEVVAGQAGSFGCSAVVDWMEDEHPYYPPVVNDGKTAEFMASVAAELLGAAAVIPDVEPTMGGEDFAYLARAAPAAFAFVGTRNETAGVVHGLHTAQYRLDETVLKKGAALHAALAMRYLERHSSGAAAAAAQGGKDEL